MSDVTEDTHDALAPNHFYRMMMSHSPSNMEQRQQRCDASGGDWVAGLSDLTSHCVARAPDAIQDEEPSETVLVAQRLKDPPPAGFADDEVASALWERIAPDIAAGKYSAHAGALQGVGPNGAQVTWPLTPGDAVWAQVPQVDGSDKTRRLGIYLGDRKIIDFGNAERALDYWKAAPAAPSERVRLVSEEEFVGDLSMRCGVNNSVPPEGRGEVVRMAVICVGTVQQRLTHPDAQHIVPYFLTGLWRMSSMQRRIPRPIRIRGDIMPASVDSTGLPGFANSRYYTILYQPGNVIIKIGDENNGQWAELVYDILQCGEELYFQKQYMEPFRDPLTCVPLAEDTAAGIMAEASEQANRV